MTGHRRRGGRRGRSENAERATEGFTVVCRRLDLYEEVRREGKKVKRDKRY